MVIWSIPQTLQVSAIDSTPLGALYSHGECTYQSIVVRSSVPHSDHSRVSICIDSCLGLSIYKGAGIHGRLPGAIVGLCISFKLSLL